MKWFVVAYAFLDEFRGLVGYPFVKMCIYLWNDPFEYLLPTGYDNFVGSVETVLTLLAACGCWCGLRFFFRYARHRFG